MYVLIAIFIIVLKAVSDGLVLAHHKEFAGIIEFIWQGGMILTIFAFFTGVLENQRRDLNRFLRVIAGFLLLRFAIFDLILNVCAGLPLFFIGTTKWYDQIWSWFFATTHVSIQLLIALKVVSLLIGISLLAKKRHGLL